jgi:hypothetical protein
LLAASRAGAVFVPYVPPFNLLQPGLVIFFLHILKYYLTRMIANQSKIILFVNLILQSHHCCSLLDFSEIMS